MAKQRGTLDTASGEFKQDNPMIPADLPELERQIANQSDTL